MSPRILVVDDSKEWREQFQDILEVMGHEVDAVEGFDEAKGLLKLARYDLVVLDICLNESDPCYVSFQKLCLFLRENNPELPVLAVSGEKIAPKFMFDLRDQGVSDFVSKNDLMLSDFRKRVDELIHTDRAPRETAVVSILFLAADPTDASRLRLGEEFREIQASLKRAKLRDRFRLELPQLSIRPRDISQAFLDVQPNVVHFSGHSTAAGALCFENESGHANFVDPAALAALFERFASQVNCVVLNACYSEIQADAISNHIKHVIGMNQAIGDKAAIAFSIGFYQALGAGCTFEEAYDLGRTQIQLQGITEHLTPVYMKKA